MSKKDGFLSNSTSVEFIKKEPELLPQPPVRPTVPEAPADTVIDEIREHAVRALKSHGVLASLRQLLIERLIYDGQERYSLHVVIETKKAIKNTLLEFEDAIITGRDASDPLVISDEARQLTAVSSKRLTLTFPLRDIMEREFEALEQVGLGLGADTAPVRVLYLVSVPNGHFQTEVEFPSLVRFTCNEKLDGFETKVERLFRKR